jgi:hypothetical protein
VRPQVLALCLHLRVEAAHNLVQLFRSIVRLGIAHQALVWKIVVGVHRVDGLVPEFLGQAKADLLDLVARQFVLPGEAVRILLGTLKRSASTAIFVGLNFRFCAGI